MRSLVYLESGFWKNLSENKSREGIRTMLDVSDALVGSEVVVDLDEETVSRDKFLMIILKHSTYKRCDQKYISKQIETMCEQNHTDNLCATYLLDRNNTECKAIEDNYGVLALNPTTFLQRNYIFKGDGFCLDKKMRYKSRYLAFKSKLFHPCNSLIIIDPYLLIKREVETDGHTICYPEIKYNLESLLDAMLPLNLSIDFHLTIISCLEIPDEIDKVYSEIDTLLKRIRTELTVKLCIVYTSKGYSPWIESFHSRHILSNTYIIDSEDGFNLFNKMGYLTKNNPSVSIVFPRLFGDSRQDITKYYNWILSVKKYFDETKYIKGDKDNRLLELI